METEQSYGDLVTDPTLDKDAVEPQEPAFAPIGEIITPQFLFLEAYRKIGYAKELNAQYQKEKESIEAIIANPNYGKASGQAITQDLNEIPAHNPETLLQLNDELEEINERITSLQELLQLETVVVDEPDIEKSAEAARQVANFVFPLDLNNYKKLEDLQVLLDVKENRLNALANSQDPHIISKDRQLVFANWAEARDLKNAVTAIRGEIARRERDPANKHRPSLRLVTPLVNHSSDSGPGEYNIDDIGTLETRLYILENRAKTLQKKLQDQALIIKEQSDYEKELHYLQDEEIPTAKQELEDARTKFSDLISSETGATPIPKAA